MIFTSHALTGAALATATSSPIVAFLLGLGSHFILDLIPHLDPDHFINHDPNDNSKPYPFWMYLINVIDIMATLIFFWLVRNNPNFNLILIGGLGGVSVDLIDNNPLFNSWRNYPFLKQIHWFHNKLHWHFKKVKWYWCLFFEIIILGVVLWSLHLML